MNTAYLKYAVEVAKCGSITQAAENLFMAQPNLSKAIKELEESLGIVIFRRSSRGMVPTPCGNEFLARARNVLTQLYLMENLGKAGEAETQRLSVCIPRDSCVADAVAWFIAELDMSRKMEVRIMETNVVQAITGVSEGRYSLGLVRYPVSHDAFFADWFSKKELMSHTIWEFDYRLTLHEDHPLSDKEDITADDLAPYTEIACADDDAHFLPDNEVTSSVKLIPAPRRVCVLDRSTRFDLMDKIPDAYMWMPPVPRSFLKKNHWVQKICLSEREKSRDTLIWRKDYSLGHVDELFINKLTEARDDALMTEDN